MLVEFVLALAGLSVFVGYVIDRILSAEKRERAAVWAEHWWLTLDEIPVEQILRNASVRFSRLFDFIYGPQFWSLRRLGRSFLSTLFALVAMTFLIGPSRTFLAELRWGEVSEMFASILLVVFLVWHLNIFVDYVSLAETRLVLTLSYRTQFSVLVLSLFDIALTVLIFAVGWFGMFFTLHLFGMELGDGTLKGLFLEAWKKFQSDGLDTTKFGLFFFSTFVTSAVWILYVASAVVLRLLVVSNKVVKPIMVSIRNTKKPGQIVGSTCALILLGLYGFIKLVYLLS